MLSATLPICGRWLLFAQGKDRSCGLVGCVIAIAGAVWLSVGAVADEHAPNPLLGNTLQISPWFLRPCTPFACGGGCRAGIRPCSSRRFRLGQGLFFYPRCFCPAWGCRRAFSRRLPGQTRYLGLGFLRRVFALWLQHKPHARSQSQHVHESYSRFHTSFSVCSYLANACSSSQ